MECIPCLANRLGTWSANGTGDMVILDIPLKTGVTFHDGSKFNASAAKWNFDRLQFWTYGWDVDGGDIYTPGDGVLEKNLLGTSSMSLYSYINTPILNHTDIIDEYTIRFVLNMECVVWEKLLAFVGCAMVLPDPNYEYGTVFFNQIDFNDKLIGTGPFMLTKFVVDNEYIFDYYPDYHKTWADNHIEQMIYLIIPDPLTIILGLLDHVYHWGWIAPYYDEQWGRPELVRIGCKRSVVYYIQMNLYTMKWEYRYASSLIWNHTYFLEEVLGGRYYELHVSVPDGMEYHHKGFEGEPEQDIRQAQLFILNSADSEIQANLTLNNLSPINTTEEWRAVADSISPLAEFNYTRYESGIVELCGTLLKDYLKNIGIKLNILDSISWDDWEENYLDAPSNHTRLCYSFGRWDPDYNDPINMIEPLYGTNASWNCFSLNNATWNQKLLDTYSATGDDRRDLFYDIQEDFCLYQVPSFYIFQLGGTIGFNRDYIDEDSVGDLLNIFAELYWFNVKFTPPIEPTPPIIIFGVVCLSLISVSLSIYIPIIVVKEIKHKKYIFSQLHTEAKGNYCPDCGQEIPIGKRICEFCGKIIDT